MGEPRRRLPRLQPSQGRQDPGRGAHAPQARAAGPARRPAVPVRLVPGRRAQRRLAHLSVPGADQPFVPADELTSGPWRPIHRS
ncbi:MAG: hypothetical protein M3Y40_04370 [Chloroflexota bacterium]|nr:hypothetical protein [Chloroflexota bacterium]